ncbi:MAG: NAD-dependent epimerase/dehydratase family protein, partial [Coriobacteriia bacterium]|nr:NAD-dependent epimerase/dehydratase family protein [Coriobacteriia bacterium]
KVIGITINHENMTDAEVGGAIERYESELGIPATDALTRSPDRLVEMVVQAFPELEQKLDDRVLDG